MRVTSPSTLLLGVVLFCIATALAAISLATSPAWLGVGLEASAPDAPLTVATLDPNGPAARAGIKAGERLTAVGATALTGSRLEGEDGAATQAGAKAGMVQHDLAARALKARPLRLSMLDVSGAARTVTLDDRPRPLSTLGAEFWANMSFGLIAALICGWVWALRPREPATQLFALTGLSMLAFTFGWAVHSTVELAMDARLVGPTMWLNMAGAIAYGGAMIAFFLCYPKRLAPAWLLLAMGPAAVGLWMCWPLLPGNPSLGGVGQGFTVIEMALIIVAIGVQVVASRKDPAAMAATRWLGLSVIVGAGAFIGSVALPAMIGKPPILDPRFSLGFFVIIYIGMAVGLRRHKLFELDQWAFRILFYLGAGIALLVLDAILLAGLRYSPQASLGAALLIVAFAYLPFRDVLWRRTVARRTMKDHEMFAAVAQVALTHQVEAREAAWRDLLGKIYEPLEVTTAPAASDKAAIVDEGVAMTLPPAAGAPALLLRFPARGRGLFGTAQVQLADQLVTLLTQIEQGRDAYARGVVEERLRIARDLHDDVGARLLSGLHRQELTQTHEAMRGAIGDLRAIVSGLSGHELPLDEVLADLRHETAERLAAAGLTLDWPPPDLEEPSQPAPYRVYKNLTSACREVISNAIRHAGASHLAVTVLHTSRRLEMTISDDGVGLPDEPGRRSGLANLERRLGEIGGEVTFPKAARGAVVRLSVPLNDGPA
jgi:signal transduction histidine kinase